LVQALLKNAYHDDHIHQAGKRYPVFAERCYQRGHGLSNIFGGLFKAAMPLLKKGVKTLGFKNGIKHCRLFPRSEIVFVTGNSTVSDQTLG
jgi:hypothetical protein